MPSSYTNPVREGKATLQSFAWHASQAFFHDGWMSVEADEKGLIDEAGRITDLTLILDGHLKMTLLEQETEFQARLKQVADQNRQWREEREITRKRYEVMLGEVQAWEPGSDELGPLKAYMIEQLRGSIEFDCGEPPSIPAPESSEENHDRRTEEYQRMIAWARERYEQTVKNLERKRAYLAALEKSLGPKPGQKEK